jgi:hypothetical protein
VTITTAFTPVVQIPARYFGNGGRDVCYPPRLHIKDAVTRKRIAVIYKLSDGVLLQAYGQDNVKHKTAIEAIEGYCRQQGIAITDTLIGEVKRLDEAKAY